MKALRLLLFILTLGFTTTLFGQTKGVLPDKSKPEGTFTEWQKLELTFDGGEKAVFEYRIAFAGKKAMACNYILEVKNTANFNVKFVVGTHYFDKLVKKNFGDILEEKKVKPGKVVQFKILTQGAKKAKEDKDKEMSDIEICLGCDFSYEITVIKE